MTDFELENRCLEVMPLAWALRWCGAGMCACLGCANISGGLANLGVSEEQWRRVVRSMVERAKLAR